MPDPISALLIAGVVGLGGLAVFGSWYLSAKNVAKRRLAAVRRCTIADAPDDEVVRIQGRVVVDEGTITAPLSDRECVYFDVLIEEKTNDSWYLLVEERRGCTFLIEDQTGLALVEASRIEGLIVKDHRQTSGLFNGASPKLTTYLKRHDQKSTGWLGLNNALRYLEGVLAPGETISVIGRARWEAHPDAGGERAGYRGIGKRLRLVAPDAERAVFVTDDPDAMR